MKTGLIGLSNNIKINKEKIKVWSQSFKKYSDGEIILLVANPLDGDLDICNELGIKYHVVDGGDQYYLNNNRLLHTFEYLKTSDIDIFMVTDVFDVVFQSNPFNKFDLVNYDFFVSGEGILVSEEPWNSDVIKKCFPNDLEGCKKMEIVCSGVMGGKRESLIPILSKMYDMCVNAENGHNIRDQAALMIMISKNEIERIKIFNLNDGWAMHCATSGPTEFLIGWGLKNNLDMRYGGIPKMINDVVYTHNDVKYDIVHQFNRIKDWNDKLIKPYE